MISFDKIPDALQSSVSQSREAIEAGLSYVRSSVSGLPLLSSLVASQQGSNAQNETHYFLVPYRVEPCGYILFTIKRLPEGYGAVNDLPQVRVFHLPSLGAEKQIEAMIMQSLVTQLRSTEDSQELTLADRLRTMADEIDIQSKRVTGGLLIIGGIAAVVNPVVGVAIMAKALLPSLGAAASREGLRHAASKLTAWNTSRKENALQGQAKATYKTGGDVCALVNPLLQALEKTIDTPAEQFDPLVDFDFDSFHMDGWDAWEILKLSCHAVTEVYSDVLADTIQHTEAHLEPENVQWLRIIQTYARENISQ